MNLQEQISRIQEVMGINESFLDWFKSPENKNDEISNAEEERFTCADCGTQDYSMYMVNDDLWKKYGNEKFTLCKSCLEKRIGRKLTKKDISQHKDALVNIHNPEMRGLNESSFLRRRVDVNLLDDEFIRYLNYITNYFLKKLDDGEEIEFYDFKRRIIDGIMDNFHGELSNWGLDEFPYDEIYDFLLERYLPKIESRYNSISRL
jgi:hypothetical protein